MIDYIDDPYSYANFGWIWLGGEFPPNTWNITSLWLFVVSLFSCTRLEQKPVNGFARSMAQNACNQPRISLWGFRKQISPHPISTHWRNNRPCRPCNAGGLPARVGGPCANPRNVFHVSCRLCIVMLSWKCCHLMSWLKIHAWRTQNSASEQ